MEHDWENEDEEGYAGPDGYLDDNEVDIEDQLMQDDPNITEEQSIEDAATEEDDGLNAQRQSMLEMLDTAFISVFPTNQPVQSVPGWPPTANLASSLTMDQVRLLLATAQSRGIRGSISHSTGNDEDDPDYVPEDDDEEDNRLSYFPWNRRPSQVKNWFKPVTKPQKAGVELMNGGEFGRLGAKKTVNIRRKLKEREMGRRNGRRKGLGTDELTRNLTPNCDGTIVASYGSNAYSGQYSAGESPTGMCHKSLILFADSSFYYTCCQDWRLHIYDTKAPFVSATRVAERTPQRRRLSIIPEHETTMKTIKTVAAVPGSWTITDSHLSPDNERLIYSSIMSTIYMTKTFEPSSPQIPLRFGSRYHRYEWDNDDSDYFGIYSCRFSADGNEVIAGGNGHQGELRVYNLVANRKTITIEAHADDVNSCCWADSASGNVLISASDDTFLKVWDRRSLGSTQRPSGVLVGHTEGITYVSAKGDGRYLISNGKDQAMRLWDLRKMRSHTEFEAFQHEHYGQASFDYRHGSYIKPRYKAHPKDCSVMTYRGHQVFRTLIRCHFSPIETTGANYLYTGSSDGRIHIYSLDGRVVQVLDRSKTLPMSFDPSDRDPGEPLTGHFHPSSVCVRDVSWHSQEPALMSVAWESGHSQSSVARHEWKGIGKLGGGMGKIEDYVERQKLERAERAARRASQRAQDTPSMPGLYRWDDDE